MKLFFDKAPFISLLFFFPLLWWSCNTINPAEPIPAYIQIDSVKIKTEAGQGSASQKITDAWITMNGNDAGVYEIPKRFPLLANGETKLIISPGILQNGSSSIRTVYPFYFPDTVTLNIQSKEIYKINPAFHYRTPTKFSFIEDFESGNLFVRFSGDTNMIRTNEASQVFEGNYCGQIHTDASHVNYEGITSDVYPLPDDGTAIYMEMNYKCNMTFQLGVQANNASGSNAVYEWVINPKEGWNKIYLNLTDVVKLLGGGSYRILILAQKPAEVNEGNIFLDNVKLLHF